MPPRRRRLFAAFPLGQPILAMIVIALATGAIVSVRPAPQSAEFTVWVFADAHARSHRTLLASPTNPFRTRARIETVSTLALNMRLTSLIASGDTDAAPPDAVEIEIGSIGRYFRPPADQVGFLPLNHYLATTGPLTIPSLAAPGLPGQHARLLTDNQIYTYTNNAWQPDPSRTQPDTWLDRIVPSRFAPWTKSGQIFGLPHDVHPVTITYRHDLFTEAGVDLPSATTWPAFHDACLRFQSYWRSRGYANRYAMELPLASAENVIVILLQRHVNVVDATDHLHVTDPKVAQTIAFYAQLVTGPKKIGVESSGGLGVWARDLLDGNTCALITPDWRIADLKSFAPELAGKLRMMPLPVFDPSDARTSTWGGTMIAIPRHAKNPDASWKLIETLYLSDAARRQRRATSPILSPLPEDYASPEYHRPDPYFGGQPVQALYATLAPTIPPRTVSPLTVGAQIAVGIVLSRAVDSLRTTPTDTGQLEAQCAAWLKEADLRLRQRLAHSRLGASSD